MGFDPLSLQYIRLVGFHTPLTNGFILVSDVYHDFYRWPLVDRKVFERWRETTAWGQKFLAIPRLDLRGCRLMPWCRRSIQRFPPRPGSIRLAASRSRRLQ